MDIQYFISFFLFALFGAMIITGFFNVTRGEYKIMPDGTIEKEGQIFRNWYFFWYKQTKPKIYQFSGAQMVGILAKLKQSGCLFGIEQQFDDHITVNSMPDGRSLEQYAMMLSIMIVPVPPQVGDKYFDIYFRKEEKAYVFPWWLRKMMAGCIPCHSSWLGSIIYWVTYYLLNANNGIPMDTKLVIMTWIAYCLSLAFLSPFLWKKIN